MTVSGFSTGAVEFHIIVTSGALVGTVAKYRIPTSGVLLVDMSDLVRVSSTGSVTLSEHNSSGTIIGSTVSRSWTRSGLINPSSVLIPDNPVAGYMDANIIAPSYMLKPISSAGAIIFETFGSGYDYSTGRVKFIPSENVVNLASTITVEDNAQAVEFWHLSDVMYVRYELVDLEKCKEYAAVEWLSFSGVTRRHTFEVIRSKIETIGALDILTIGNGYDERKGRRDSFVLRLENLNRYDFWYYADLINSSSVRVLLSGKTWQTVQVTTKAVDIPDNDEGRLNTLDIEINYREYDTI